MTPTGVTDGAQMEEDGDAYLVRLMREYESCAGDDDDDDGGGFGFGGGFGGGGDARATRARAGDEIGAKRAREGARGEDAGKRAKTAETTTTTMTTTMTTMTTTTMTDASSASSMATSSGDVDMAMSPLRAKLPWGGGFPADPSAAR